MADRTDWTGHQFEHFPSLQDSFNDLMRAFGGIDALIAELRTDVAPPRQPWWRRTWTRLLSDAARKADHG